MKSSPFFETMAEWEYALNHHGEALPWKVILTNNTKSQSVTIYKITKLDALGLKLITDNNEIIISPEHNWRIKHGCDSLNKTIFTHDLSY